MSANGRDQGLARGRLGAMTGKILPSVFTDRSVYSTMAAPFNHRDRSVGFGCAGATTPGKLGLVTAVVRELDE